MGRHHRPVGGSSGYGGLTGDRLLDAWIFARDDRAVRHVWAAGRHVVADGRHAAEEVIADRYRATVRRLKDIL
jgi:formimidoylglutamate deiminase